MSENPDNNNHGEILRKAREGKGFTLDMIHEATKIPLDILRAIEEGYRVGTLSPFYLRGFVKIYAQFLDLDPEEVLRDMTFNTDKDPLNYMALKQPNKLAKSDRRKPVAPAKVSAAKPAPQPQSSAQKTPGTSTGSMKNRAAAESSRQAADAAVVKLKKASADFHRWLTPDRRQRLLKVFGVVFLIFMSFKILGFIASKIANRKPAKPEVMTAAPKASTKGGDAAQALSSPAQPTAAASSQTPVNTPASNPVPVATKPAASKPVSLTVRANRDSWMQVKTDGAIVFQSIMSKGVTETWFANEQIELSGRNISHLEFEVNGKHIGTLGRSDRKAKRVIVSKKGMNVEK